MKMLSSYRAVAVTTALGLLTTAGVAHASRTQTDGAGETIATVCTPGMPCTATPLSTSFGSGPLTANFGFGPFSSVYFYNNGLVSIGAPITTTDFSSLATIGGNVFTAGYSPTMTLSAFTIEGPQTAVSGAPGKPVVRIRYRGTFSGTSEDMEFNIFDLGDGSYELEFNHGNQDGTGSIDFPTDGYLGYKFGSNVLQLNGPAVQAADRLNTDFAYIFRANATPGVPEPASWAMLTLGFCGLGVAMRRARRSQVIALS